MTKPGTRPPKHPRWRRWLRRLVWGSLVSLLLLAALVFALAWWFTRPQRLARLIEGALADQLPLKVSLASADLSLDGRLVVDGLCVRLPEGSPEWNELARARRCTLQIDRDALWQRRLVVKRVDLEGVDLRVVEEAATERVNWSTIDFSRLGAGPGGAASALPQATLKGGTVHFLRLESDARPPRPLADWGLEAALRPQSNGAHLDAGFARPDGDIMTAEADLNLVGKTARVVVGDATLRPELALLTPVPIRRWWRKAAPAGELPHVSADLDFSKGLRLSRAEVSLLGLEVAPDWARILGDSVHTPLGAALVPADGAPSLRFDGMSGQVVIEGDLVRVPDLTTTVHGEVLGVDTVQARLSGRLDLTGATGWTMGLTTEPFEAADQIPVLSKMAETREIYQRFQPSGRFSVSATAGAPAAGAPRELEARIEILDAKACYERVPYPVEHLRGTLVATLDSIHIEHLQGAGVHGGRVRIQGTVAPLTDESGADILVAVEGVPWGPVFRDALPPGARRAAASFMREDLAEEWRRRGLAQDFTPGGLVNAEVKVRRQRGAEGQWTTDARIDAAGLRVMHEGFAYPLTIVSGEINAGDYAVETGEITARAANGAALRVKASAADTNGNGDFGWQATVLSAKVPVDPLLLAALPKDSADLIADLALAADLTLSGTIRQAEEAAPGTGLRIALQGGTRGARLRPFRSDYAFQEVSADFRLGESTFSLSGIAGEHTQPGLPPARFRGDAEVAWDERDTFVSLHVAAEDLAITPDLAQLAPPDGEARRKIQEAMAAWRPGGMAAGELLWSFSPQADTVNLAIRPREAAFTPPGGRGEIRLSGMDGVLTFTPQQVVLEDLSARFDGGQALVNGTVGDAVHLAIEGLVAVKAGEVPDTLKVLLPEQVTAAVRKAALDGTLILSETRVDMPAGGGVSGQAKIEAQSFAADVGVPLTDAHGRLRLRFGQDGPGGGLSAQGEVGLDRLRLLDRPLENFSGALAIGGDGEMRLEDMRAEIANGSMLGTLVAKDGRFALDLELCDASWDLIAHPDPPAGGKQARDGLLRARLRLRGEAARGIAGLEGDGRLRLSFSDFESTDRRMRLVELLNGIAPGTGAIAQATVSTDIALDGGLVHIENLVLDASSGLRIAGVGTADLRDGALDMQLITRNREPGLWGQIFRYLEPVTDEILGLKVTGTLDDPKVQADSFSGLRGTLKDLLPGAETKPEK